MKKFCLSVMVGLCTMVSHAQDTNKSGAQYEAQEKDSKVSQMLERWSQVSNQAIYWDVNQDFRIKNHADFNEKAGFTPEDKLVDSVKKVIEYVRKNRLYKERLIACVDDNGVDVKIAVRPQSFGCSK